MYRLLFSLLLLFIFSGCLMPMEETTIPGETEQGILLKPKSTLSYSRIRIPMPVNVVIDKRIHNGTEFTSSGVEMRFANYRDAIKEQIADAFVRNFADLYLTEEETGQSIEIIVTQATITPKTTLKFHSVLLHRGKQIGEVYGETTGRTIMMGSTAFTYKRDLKQVTKTLLEEAIDKMSVQFYNAYIRGNIKWSQIK